MNYYTCKGQGQVSSQSIYSQTAGTD